MQEVEKEKQTTLCDRFSRKELMWITLINKGYLPYCKNFLKSMAQCHGGVAFILVVFCLDKETLLALRDEPLCCCLYADFILDTKRSGTGAGAGASAPLASDLKQWGQLEYKRLVFAKLDAIQHTLQLVQGWSSNVKYVGYIDTDIWLFKDPTPAVLALAQANPTVSVLAQCDEACGVCSQRTACPNLCSGVMLFRTEHVAQLVPLLTYHDHEIPHYMGDQDYLLAKFRRYNVKTLTFDKRVIQNGAIPGLKERKLMLPLHPACCLLHFNYLIGSDKQRVMKMQGLWYT